MLDEYQVPGKLSAIISLAETTHTPHGYLGSSVPIPSDPTQTARLPMSRPSTCLDYSIRAAAPCAIYTVALFTGYTSRFCERSLLRLVCWLAAERSRRRRGGDSGRHQTTGPDPHNDSPCSMPMCIGGWTAPSPAATPRRTRTRWGRRVAAAQRVWHS